MLVSYPSLHTGVIAQKKNQIGTRMTSCVFYLK